MGGAGVLFPMVMRFMESSSLECDVSNSSSPPISPKDSVDALASLDSLKGAYSWEVGDGRTHYRKRFESNIGFEGWEGWALGPPVLSPWWWKMHSGSGTVGSIIISILPEGEQPAVKNYSLRKANWSRWRMTCSAISHLQHPALWSCSHRKSSGVWEL